MKSIKDKIKSRKLWVTILTMIVGIATSLMDLGGNIGAVCGIIVTCLAPVIYIITEGVIDAKAVQMTADSVKIIVEELKKEEAK
jgi:hypothetical protein